MSALVLYALVVAGLAASVVRSQPVTNDTAILLQFKRMVQPEGPSGILGSWGAGGNATAPCGWNGVVQCISSRVASINLDGANLQGDVGAIAVLASLPMLTALSLSGNNFSRGSISALALNSSGSCALEYLDLSYNFLEGNFTEDIFGACTGLRTLNLTHNRLMGTMPTEFFSGPSIEVLDLSYNLLTGPLPAAAANCSSLEVLNVSNNNFTGDVPRGFGRCPKLAQIDLSRNSLLGGLPADLFSGNCIAGGQSTVCPPSILRELNISFNNISGPLPITGFCTPSLQVLDLACNKLSGGLPAALGNCSGLVHLNLSRNGFSGEPSGRLAFPNGCALQVLDLAANANLSGSFPSPLLECASLQTLVLAGNNFSGAIPGGLAALKSLEHLILGMNNFSGLLPAGVAGCPNLRVLDLCSNNVGGKIPTGICSPSTSSQLHSLMLQDNYFTGPIPPDLSECRELVRLDLSFNRLTGAIPGPLGSLAKLESLILWNNALEGNIPTELSRLSNLKLLILNNNRLQGPIPPELSNCTMLEWLSLANNNFTGTIPPQTFHLIRLGILQLGNNSLTGTIPMEIGNATNLFWIDLSFNKLTGTIPALLGQTLGAVDGTLFGNTVGFLVTLDPTMCNLGFGGLIELAGIRTNDISRLQACKTRLYSPPAIISWHNKPTVIYLDLSYNNLYGSIPQEIGNLGSLQVLNLGHNSLSGPIPSDMSQCSELMGLDLSSNSLSGYIPPLFINLTMLSSLNLSSNLLYGPIPQGGQFLTFPSWVYSNNLGLCGGPLSTPCPSSPDVAPSPAQGSGGRGLMASRVVWILFLAVGATSLGLVLFWMQQKSQGKYCCRAKVGDPKRAGPTFSIHKAWDDKDLGIHVTIVEIGACKNLTFGDLLVATDNFNPKCVVGVGGFGEVYRAELDDGTVIAVKKLVHFSYQGEREFLAEMEILSKIKHKNLVRLLGFCKVKEERLLIYEYMSNGSLECALHGEGLHPLDLYHGPRCLPWAIRKRIALDAARGLAFLHHSCEPHIIHRDFKSSNVLLDTSLGARVSDFGMARVINEWETHLSVTTLTGTPGYVPPEYYQSFRCTRQGDVYSYGVVLLELISGRRPTEKEEFGDSNLVGWTKKKICENLTEDVFDPVLKNQGDADELLQYVKVACACLEDSPSSRPTMLWVVANFKEISIDFQSSQCVLCM